MKSGDLKRWLGRLRVLTWPTVLVLAALAIGLLKGPGGPPNSFDVSSADGLGVKALALYLKGSGWQVSNQVIDPPALPPASGVLVLTAENLSLLDPVSGYRLAAWVRAGGRLIILGGTPLQSAQSAAASGRSPTNGTNRRVFEFAPPPLMNTGAPAGEVYLDHAEAPFSGVRRLVGSAGERWDTSGRTLDDWESVLSNIDGAVVLRRRSSGTGQVLALADPSPLTNQHLRDADNLALALALTGGDQRHELGVYTIDPMTYLRRALAGEKAAPLPLSWRLLPWGLALAGIFGFWLSGRRTGPVLAAEPPPARPATEFLQAQAHAYRRARANAAVLRYVYGGFRRDVARRAGLPSLAPLTAIVSAAPRLGVPPAELRALMERVERSLARPKQLRPLTEVQMLTLVRDLVVMQRRMGHARG